MNCRCVMAYNASPDLYRRAYVQGLDGPLVLILRDAPPGAEHVGFGGQVRAQMLAAIDQDPAWVRLESGSWIPARDILEVVWIRSRLHAVTPHGTYRSEGGYQGSLWTWILSQDPSTYTASLDVEPPPSPPDPTRFVDPRMRVLLNSNPESDVTPDD